MDSPVLPLVVGVGASAGGLDALLRLIPSLSPGAGVAVVVVQHLEPTQPSALASILAGHARLPVVPITPGLRLEADRVYVAPPNVFVRLDEDRFEVTAPVAGEPVRHPIDAFLASLAATRGDACAAVVLSGTGTDGAAGVRSVKAGGGLVLAQSDAAYPGMPEAAIATGIVDRVLPAAEMHEDLVRFARDRPPSPSREPGASIDGRTLAEIQALLLARTGHDFSGYKASTLLRRIQRRLATLQADTPDRYVAILRADPDEAHLLMADLLIGVTHFFRDPDAFAALDQQVLTPLVAERAGTAGEIRVWVPGCSTGEEVYSLAILLQEALERGRGRPAAVTLFGTDIDPEAIETARRGYYPASIADHLSRERLDRFFVRDRDGWRVARNIRDLCIFSTHSVIRDPPFARLDLVSCRNLLIYLSADLQFRLARLFNYVLNPDGYLFLGPSESVDRPDLFAVVDKKFRILRRLEAGSHPVIDRPIGVAPLLPMPAMLPSRSPSAAALARTAERLILETYAPPCVVVDRSGQIVCTSGRTSRYLELPAGAPSLNVADLVCGALRFDLRDAMERCRRSGDTVTVEDIPVTTEGVERRVDLLVRPFGERAENTLLIVFRESASAPRDREAAPDARIARLEAELGTARNRLQAAVDELSISREDFQQTNEELLSLNEELQAANEELQTSKEEMQSVNEEVETVNAELRQKVEELDHANSDLQNLFRTQIATVFLDRELRIKRFTPACQRLFRLVDTDVGRPIGHILPLFAYQGLDADIREVLESLAPIDREVPSADGSAWYGMRILPYRTTDDLIAGVVLTFVDLTATRQLQRRSALLAAIVDSSSDAIYSTAPDGTLTSWNAAAARLFGWEPADVLGRREAEVFPGAETAPAAPGAPAGEGPSTSQLRRKDGSLVEVLVTSSPIREPSGGVIGRSHIVHDISQRRLLEAELEQARKMEGLGLLAGGIAHDFNNLLTTIVGHASLAERKLGTEHPVRAHLRQIIATSERSTALTRQLLAFAGREVVPARVVDANVLLEEFTPILQGLIPASIEVVVRHADEPALVRIDRSRLEQVLMNLVVNARDAMPDGGRLTVTVSTVQDARAGQAHPGVYMRLTVTDIGEGMTPEQRAHCFDPFYTTKSAGRSSGLGLASAYGIVHGAGGFIEVDSARGRGSAFAVHLPRVTVAPIVAPELPELGPDPVGTETILLAEDTVAVRETSVGILRAQGYTVLAASDGVDALAVAERHERTIDALVTDVVMPRMGGRQLALALRARHPGVRVLYVTGYAPEDNAEAVEGSELLLKPFTPSALARAVRGLLDR